MPNQPPTDKAQLKRWQARRASRSAADTVLASMLLEMEQRAETAWNTYFARLQALLTQDEYALLIQVWNDGQPTPAALAAKIDADAEAVQLVRAAGMLAWYLESAQQHRVVSEHYVYRESGGTLRGPNGER